MCSILQRTLLAAVLVAGTGPALAQAITARDSRILVLGSTDLPGTPNATLSNVRALAAGDFNCDGNDDLAVGDASAPVIGLSGAGAVSLRYGDFLRGLDGATQVMTMATPNVAGSAQQGAQFGFALARWFEARGAACEDLAVGAPGYDAASRTDSGFVVLLRGANSGLNNGRVSVGLPKDTDASPRGHTADHRKGTALATLSTDPFNGPFGAPGLAITAPGHNSGLAIGAGGYNWHRTGAGTLLSGSIFVERNQWPGEFGRNIDNMGRAVAAGDFDDDGFDDIVVQARHVDGCLSPCPFPEPQTGALFIEYGGGLVTPIREKLSQATPGIAGTPENGDRFGEALAVGDFNGDGYSDLAIGIPGETSGDDFGAGMVTFVFGGPNGLLAEADRSVTFTQADLPGVAREDGDEFGAALAAARISGQSFDDLVIGSPGEDEGNTTDSGIVHIVPAGWIFSATTHFSLASTGVVGTPRSDDRLGQHLAAGDFNDDGFDDIAAAIPRVESTGRGEVLILYASAPTTTRIISISPNPVMAGRPATVRISVDRNGDPTTRGIAMPSIAGGLACEATLNSGTGEGSCSLNIGSTGVFTVRADYLGAVGFAPSTAQAPLPTLTVIPFVDAVFRNGFE